MDQNLKKTTARATLELILGVPFQIINGLSRHSYIKVSFLLDIASSKVMMDLSTYFVFIGFQ